MDHRAHNYHSYHHRQSLRPSSQAGSSASSALASRYGLSSSGSSSGSRNGSQSLATNTTNNASGMGAGLSSSVVSFMRKFVSKATPNSGNSIDSSFEKYHQQQKQLQLQQQQQQQIRGQSPPKFTTVAREHGSQASQQHSLSQHANPHHPLHHHAHLQHHHHQHSDTGYSSNANSPATTPTVCSSSMSASPVPAPTLSQPASACSYGNQSTNQNLSTCSPSLSIGSLASLGSTSFYQMDGSVTSASRPSSVVSTTANANSCSFATNANSAIVGGTTTTTRGPLFSKIRAKMASTFAQSPTAAVTQSSTSSTQSSYSCSNSPLLARPKSMPIDPNLHVSKPRSSSLSSTSGQVVFSPCTGQGSGGTGASTYQRPPMLSMISSNSSSLTNEQLTAHLTEEERQILQKVFQKEEEFREIALKNFVKNTSGGRDGECGSADMTTPPNGDSNPAPSVTGPSLITSSPVSGVSHLSTNLLDPVAAAVHRRRSSAVMSADATGFCRICRKVIMKNESAHRCSNCHELVCDDCSSYSSREESKYWMCSFCRRRGSHLIIVPSTIATSSSNTVSTVSAATTNTGSVCSSSVSPRLSPNPALSTSSQASTTATSLSTNTAISPCSNASTSTVCTTVQSHSATFAQLSSGSTDLAKSSSPYLSTHTNTAASAAKRKLSFSECQRPNSSLETQATRQSSLDLQRSQPISIVIGGVGGTERKLIQLVQLPPTTCSNKQQPHRSSESTTSLGPSTECSMLSTSNTQGQTPTPTTTASVCSIFSPGAGSNNRARIYSLSDDEDLLTDDEDEDDEEEDNDQDDEDVDEEFEDDDVGGGRFRVRPLNKRRSDNESPSNSRYYDVFSPEQYSPGNGLAKTTPSSNSPKFPYPNANKKRTRKTRKNHYPLGSPRANEYDDDEYYGAHLVGGPSHGTLASVPVETLKRQRSVKKKKKKTAQQHKFNSDDELTVNYSSSNKTSKPPSEDATCDQDLSHGTVANRFYDQAKASSDGYHPMGQRFPTQVANVGRRNSLLSGVDCANVKSGQCSSQTAVTSSVAISGNTAAVIAKIISPKPTNQIVASRWWRLSKKAGSFSRSGGNFGFEGLYGTRQQRSSESSDISDFRYSPPQDSLTPSSEYSRSPRESADSDMLGLTYSSLAMQRRSIPSVLVDVSDPSGHYLSTKDCYNRRGSTGRALPKIPVEPSRSMLDLPHSRKSSQHSLDIPMEQPRRASAPEGENIRIVIDEVGDVMSSHQDLHCVVGGGSTGNIGASCTKANQVASVVPAPIQVAAHQTTYQQRMRYQLTRAASIVTHYERVVLQRDKTDHSTRTRGFGLAVIGGKLNESDGMLYAYVSWIKPNDQADKAGLKTGDKILEWCGKSLVNCSYEQVCNIMNTSGDTVELIVESMVKCDPAQRRRQSLAQQSQNEPSAAQVPQITVAANSESSNVPPGGPQPSQPSISATQASSTQNTSGATTTAASVQPHLRPSSAAAVVSTSTASTAGQAPNAPSTSAAPAAACPRRRLPQIPANLHPVQHSMPSTTSPSYLANAQILLHVTLDPNIRQLSVMIVSASGLEQHPVFESSPNNEAFAQLRLLPEMGFKICQTELNSRFEWNETLIYHQFPLERVDKITLDLSIWCTNSSSSNMYNNLLGQSIMCNPPQISVPSDQIQLASTRIPLRSALFHLSEWWPLIPTEVVAPNSAGSGSFSGQQSIDSAPSPAPVPSTAPPVFFHKVPSMDYIDVNNCDNNTLRCDPGMMMSRSTPGSRRNSGRSDTQEIIELSQPPEHNIVAASHMPTTSPGPRYRTPPTRASSTLSSSTGRHSLDDSSYSNSGGGGGSKSGGGSLSLGRSTSLRLVQNRHSVGNLYHLPASGKNVLVGGYVRNSHLAAPNYDPMMMRRKSSSALGNSQLPNVANASQQEYNRAMCSYGGQLTSYHRSGSLNANNRNKINPGMGTGGYCRLDNTMTDSYQYLLDSQQPQSQSGINPDFVGLPSDQDSDLSSDDEVDCLLEHSNYTLDSDSKNYSYQQTQQPTVQANNQEDSQSALLNVSAKASSGSNLNQLSVIDTNKLSIASIDVDSSRYSGTTTPVTPSNEEDLDDDAAGTTGGGTGGVQSLSSSSNNLLAPSWASERRGSFLRRLMPSSASSMLHSNTSGNSPNNAADNEKKVIVVGELKLGFIMTKGFLEIEVIAARGLPDSITGPYPPDTYVKTYLFDRGRALYKRKTRVVSSDKCPQYRQTLKYDASIIYGRTLLVSVWEKQRRTFDPNFPIGAFDISVNQLELHKLTIRWYRLRSLARVIPDGRENQPPRQTSTEAQSDDLKTTTTNQQTSQQQQ